MKFLVPNYSCLQNPWLRGYRPQFPFLSVLCPQLNLLNTPPPKKIPGYATASHGVTYNKTASSYSNPLSNYIACEVVFRLQFPDEEGGDYSRNQWRWNVPLQTTRRGRGVGQGPRKMYRILRWVVCSYGLDSLLLTENSTLRDCDVSLISTAIPRLTKMIRSGITFVSRNFSLSRT